MNTQPENENTGMKQPDKTWRKKRPSMLDAFAEELFQMDRDKKSLSHMLDWLQERNVTASPNNLSHYLKNLREAHALELLTQKFDSRGKKWEAVREWLTKNPRPDLGTMIEVLKMLVMDLATEETADPALLALVDKLAGTASRAEYRTRKLVMEEAKHAEWVKCERTRGLEYCLILAKEHPAVADMFRSTFAALKAAQMGPCRDGARRSEATTIIAA